MKILGAGTEVVLSAPNWNCNKNGPVSRAEFVSSFCPIELDCGFTHKLRPKLDRNQAAQENMAAYFATDFTHKETFAKRIYAKDATFLAAMRRR